MPIKLPPISASVLANNATVSNSAFILPAQAFVDNITKFIPNLDSPAAIDASNQSITHINPSLITWYAITLLYNGYSVSINLSANQLSSSEINSILNTLAQGDWSSIDPLHKPILNLGGSGNGAPTGQGITDKTSLSSYWAITTN